MIRRRSGSVRVSKRDARTPRRRCDRRSNRRRSTGASSVHWSQPVAMTWRLSGSPAGAAHKRAASWIRRPGSPGFPAEWRCRGVWAQLPRRPSHQPFGCRTDPLPRVGAIAARLQAAVDAVDHARVGLADVHLVEVDRSADAGREAAPALPPSCEAMKPRFPPLAGWPLA